MFDLEWTEEAIETYLILEQQALGIKKKRDQRQNNKSSKQEGLFKQVKKTLQLLRENPRHPGLRTHPYASLSHPFDSSQKIFEAYAQNHIAGAYRVFWCYGPGKQQITIIAISPHP